MNKVIYTENSRKDLKKLPIIIAQRIIKKVGYFAEQKDPIIFAKKLTNSSLGTYRFRVGEYRVIFDKNKNGDFCLLYILKIKHRKEVYGL